MRNASRPVYRYEPYRTQLCDSRHTYVAEMQHMCIVPM